MPVSAYGTLLAKVEDRPAGGAELVQIVQASLVFAVVLGGIAWFVLRQRRAQPRPRLSERMATVAGFPIWGALPLQLLRLSLLVALFGMYWDISLHIDRGRDAGPLANPAHWFILFGLSGVFCAGAISMALARDPLPAGTIRLTKNWRVPVGAGLLVGCGAFSLLGFPLDDVWHKLFGQDVTLFGPTHLMLIGGASLSTYAGWILLMEGIQVTRVRSSWVKMGEYAVAGGFLVGLSTFQAEFDFGVPQFRFVLEPVMVMAAASIALVTARVRLGRGGALAAWLSFLVIRGLITFLVTIPLGEGTPHFPLYLVEALLVEGVALLLGTARIVRFGVAAGLAVGTVGLAAEWGWSHVWAVLPWPSTLLPEAALLGLLTALGGGIVGAWLGARLNRTAGVAITEERSARWLAPAGLLAVLACVGIAIPITTGPAVAADVTLTPAGKGEVRLVAKLTPADAADDAEWFTATAWQGGGMVVDRLRKTGPGTWESTEPLPVHDDWKATLRLNRGSDILGLPVYLPQDDAIPAEGVPADSTFRRDFQLDKQLLQREAKQGVSPALTAAAYLAVGALAVLAILCLAAGTAYAAKKAGRPMDPPVEAEQRPKVGV
ncbi:MAG: hypothetical protein JWN77_1243 [Frankiales bacterium]|jgi:hypothetical protein|nr:hypothetical protein [Frankiales bacterium]